jgi:pyridoxal phosphate enzyme (YggS family)
MAVNEQVYGEITAALAPAGVTLVAVSKTKPAEDIQALYNLGQRDFGENYVQEITEKQPVLPADIRWHFIGHLQSNKVKYIAPFVHLIHGIDSEKLLAEVNKQAKKHNRIIDCLLQIHIAQEETKFGLDAGELDAVLQTVTGKPEEWANIRIQGLMGMASFSDNPQQVHAEFAYIHQLFLKYKNIAADNCRLSVLSMGMSGDYHTAIEEGSTMVRIGSLLFGKRDYKQ